MDIRSQISMVFHLDKCIGCHTCSIACKNIWTDRKGTEYMWWNNVETKPGTGFPTRWEDQDKYKGGWEVVDGELKLRSTSKAKTVTNIFQILICQPWMIITNHGPINTKICSIRPKVMISQLLALFL